NPEPGVPSRSTSDANATIPVNEPATMAPPSSVGMTAFTVVAPAAAGEGCDPIGMPQSVVAGRGPAPPASPAATGGATSVPASRGSFCIRSSSGNGRALHAPTPDATMQAEISRVDPPRIPKGYSLVDSCLMADLESGPLLVAVADRPAAIINSAEVE